MGGQVSGPWGMTLLEFFDFEAKKLFLVLQSRAWPRRAEHPKWPEFGRGASQLANEMDHRMRADELYDFVWGSQRDGEGNEGGQSLHASLHSP